MISIYNTIEEDLQIMQQCDIDIEELFLAKLIFLAQEDNGRQSHIIDYFLKCKHTKIPLEMLTILGDKGVLVKKSLPKSGDKFIADNLKFEDKFLKRWFVYAHVAGKELMSEYPNYLTTNSGELLPAKNITKTYVSLEAMYADYSKSIRHSMDAHQKVLNLLDWAKKNNLIKFGIAEFVASRKWESLEQDNQEFEEGTFNQVYDNKTISTHDSY